MLEQMRKQSRSLIIYVLFGVLIAVFIINFGPQSRGGCDALSGGEENAAKIDGQSVSAAAFHYAFMLMGGANQPPQMLKLRRFKEAVMDRLIERELLAQEAEHVGFASTEEDVHKMLLDGRIIGLGIPHTVPRIQKDGVFNYDLFKTFAQYELGLSPAAFIEQQRRELLAAHMRDFLRASVKVSGEEVQSEFDAKSRQVNLEYVRYPSRKFEGQVEPTTDEIAAYVKANEAKLKETYQQRKPLYTDLKPEVRVRRILLKGSDPAEVEAAKKRAAGLQARLAKGEAFSKVAREASEDDADKDRGGDLGWRRKDGLGLEAADQEKVFAAAAGTVVGPFKSSDGVVLLQVNGNRSGTQTFDQVKGELAEEKLKEQKASELAKAHAEAALARAKAEPAKTLKDLYPGPSEEGDDADKAPKARPAPGAKAAAPAVVADDARAEETGLFPRRGDQVEGIGESAELAKAAFGLKTAGDVAGPFDVAGSFVVVRLKERKDPDKAEFDKKKGELRDEAELVKWNEVLTDWTRKRCLEVKARGDVSVNRDLLKYEDNQVGATAYEPCAPPTTGRRS